MENQIKKALEAKQKAYAPYSKYKVGACLKAKSGKLYTGCNIENGGISSICAERVAFTKAISDGEKEFESIVVVAGNQENDDLDFATPCGYCRQFMSEFVDKDFKVIVYQSADNKQEFTMDELLPNQFELK